MNRIAVQSLIRFGLGASPSDAPEPDPRGALKAQLLGPDPGLASGAFYDLPTGLDAVDFLRADVASRRAALLAGVPPQPGEGGAIYLAEAKAAMDWAATTPAGFRERLVWFWTNHFTVSITQGQTHPLVGAMVREAIRPHVNGNFTDMALAAERHPAMLRYLDNVDSIGPNSVAGQKTGRGLNENLGRECMELHTVSLAAGYSQADVTSMAKILTGWSMGGTQDGGDATGFKYRPFTHEPGPQTVMGQNFDGGEQAGMDALVFLSTHPTTYQNLANKLVTHFVADDPPPAAVEKIYNTLLETGGDLAAASAALVDLPEAWAPLTKLKTPLDYMVSVLRAAPVPPGQPPVNYLNTLNQLGQPLWGAPLPNGWPDQAAGWDGSDAVMARIDWAYGYGARLDTGAQPADIAGTALGPLLRPATADAVAHAASRREALTLLFASPEFQRR